MWRLIEDGPLGGAENMARDRAIQLAVERGEAPPTLRLYSWRRPTVTLGRFQPVSGVDFGACDRLGVDVVRRFTGGRGVLHDDELTYSVIARTADGVPRGVAASYRHLCSPLAEAYRLLGVDADLISRDSKSMRSSACYLSKSRADLALGGMKLSGSAQVWHGGTVLQHGSFTISRDLDREAAVFGLSEPEVAGMRAGTTTLSEAIGRDFSAEEIAEAVVAAFSEVLDVRFEVQSLSQWEREAESKLEAEVHLEDEGLA